MLIMVQKTWLILNLLNQSTFYRILISGNHFSKGLERVMFRMIARDYRIPKSTLWDWIQRDQDLIKRYRVQQSRAMHHAHSVEELSKS